jgi:hypothetical protein
MYNKMWIFVIILLIWIIYEKNRYYLSGSNEPFGWECNWKPNKDYYKEDWLLGGEPMANALARDSIKK